MRKNIKIPLVFVLLLGSFLFSEFYEAKESGSNSILSRKLLRQPTQSLNSVPAVEDPSGVNSTISQDNENVAGSSVQQREFRDKLEQIQGRLQCYQTDSCDLPETDPKSAYFSLGQEISASLRDIQQNSDWMRSFPEEIQNLARQTILVEDGYVQEASLRLLQSYPTSEENWTSLQQALEENPEALFVQQALDELERYQKTPQSSEVSATVQSLLRGPHFTSEVVSENIFRFIDDQSVKGFESVLQNLPPNSKVAENVSRYLREYYRMKSAG